MKIFERKAVLESSTRYASRPSRLIENLLANYAYVVLMALVTLFVVPLYLHLLGGAAWSEVALCLTLQGFLFSLDLAIGPLMLRDVARACANGNAASAYARFLRIYGGTAIGVFAVGTGLLMVLARYRMANAQPLSADLPWALRFALLQFLFQFCNNAAIGYWNGREMQRFANLRLTGFALVKHALALLFLVCWSATAVACMCAFALVAGLEFFANHRHVRREQIGVPDVADHVVAKNRWRDAIGFGGAALLGFATVQIDRGYLALALPAQSYGLYFLIGAPMLSLFSLQMPIQRAFLPRLAVATSPLREAGAMLKVCAVLIVLPSLILATFPEFALRLWLHDPSIAMQGAATFRLLMLAVAFNAVFSPAALLLLNRHRNAAIAAINAGILLAQTAILIVLTPRLGMLAGAVAWLACGLLQLACATLIWRCTRLVDHAECPIEPGEIPTWLPPNPTPDVAAPVPPQSP